MPPLIEMIFRPEDQMPWLPPRFYASWDEHLANKATCAVLVLELSGYGVWYGVWYLMRDEGFRLALELGIPYVLSSEAYPVLTRAEADALMVLETVTRQVNP